MRISFLPFSVRSMLSLHIQTSPIPHGGTAQLICFSTTQFSVDNTSIGRQVSVNVYATIRTPGLPNSMQQLIMIGISYDEYCTLTDHRMNAVRWSKPWSCKQDFLAPKGMDEIIVIHLMNIVHTVKVENYQCLSKLPLLSNGWKWLLASTAILTIYCVEPLLCCFTIKDRNAY